MLQYDLNAKVRTTFGKGAAKSMRREGLTPAVMYGAKKDSVALALDTRELSRILMQTQRRNALFNLDVDDSGTSSKRYVMTKEIQTDPVLDTLVHADFFEVPIDAPIVLGVPVKCIGNAKGVEMGGVLNVTMRAIMVRGLVLDMPDYFEVDIADLDVGHSYKCNEIPIPDGLEMLTSLSDVFVSVMHPKGQDEEEEEVEEEGVEGAEGADAEAAESEESA
jgi:large subunit ribosomal protein L25